MPRPLASSVRWLALLALAGMPASVPRAANAQAPRPLTTTRVEVIRDSSPGPFAALGHRVLFAATTPGEGRELWITDGTAEGTHLVVDLHPGRASSWPRDFVAIAGRMFFVAEDASGSGRVFETDGSAEGTRRSRLFPQDRGFSLAPDTTWPGWIVATSSGGDGIWRSDGRSPAILLTKGSGWNRVHHMVAAGGALYVDWWSVGFSRIHRFAADGTLSVVAESGRGATLVGALGDRVVFVTRSEDAREAPDFWVQSATGPAVRIRPPELVHARVGVGATTARGVLLFPVRDAGDDAVPELWQTDGTAEGTRRVTTIGRAGSLLDSDPVAAGDRVFLVVRDPLGARELWASNGTAPGTARIALAPLGDPVAIDARVVFSTGVESRFSEEPVALRVSDGTAAGTREVARFPRPPSELARVGDDVWFGAIDGAGEEPWRTDGTIAGTRRVADVSSEPGGAEPAELTALGAAVIFAADDAAHGRELWRADAGGAALLSDLRVGPEGAAPQGLVRAGDRVFLLADDGVVVGPHGPRPIARLVRTDGTPEETTDLRSGIFLPACGFGSPGCVDRPIAVGRRVHFVDAEASIEGTHFVADDTGSDAREIGHGGAFVWWPTLSGEDLWFVGNAGLVRATRERMVEVPAPAGRPVELTAAGDRLFMAAAGAVAPYVEHGLWARERDGRLHLVHGFDLGDFELAPYGVGALTWIAPLLYFAGSTRGEGLEPWTSDGTASGTTSLGDIAAGPAGSKPAGFVGLGRTVFFWADDGVHGREPWVTDGTPAGTRLVADLWPGPASSEASSTRFVPLAPAGPMAFAASDGTHGAELWVSDGTADGTRRVSDLAPGVRSSSPEQLVVAGDHLFFAADDSVGGGQIFAVRLSDLAPSAERFPPEEAPLRGGCTSGDGGVLSIVAAVLALCRVARNRRRAPARAA